MNNYILSQILSIKDNQDAENFAFNYVFEQLYKKHKELLDYQEPSTYRHAIDALAHAKIKQIKEAIK